MNAWSSAPPADARATVAPHSNRAAAHQCNRANDAPAFSPPAAQPQFTPRAKSVIWIFLIGGLSHLVSFAVKPELNKYAGKLIEDTPPKGVVNDALSHQNLPNVDTQKRDVYKKSWPQHRLPHLRPERVGGEQLAPAPRLVRRRPRGGALVLDD